MKKTNPSKNFFNHIFFYQAALTLARFLPRKITHVFSKVIALFWYYADKKTRQQVEGNLQRVVGTSPAGVRRYSRELFLNYAVYLADWARFVMLDSQQVFSFFNTIEGEDVFHRAHRNGKGVIILAAHLGNWELGGIFCAHLGVPFNIITAQDEVQSIAQVRTHVRALHHVKTITIKKDPFFLIDVVNVLRNNEVVAMLVDRYDRHNGILVDFFGEPSYFPAGPVVLAQLTQAPLLPTFTVLEPNGKYRLVVGDPVPMEWSGDKTKDMYINVSRIAKIFEGYIRAYPGQWYNFSSLWRW